MLWYCVYLISCSNFESLGPNLKSIDSSFNFIVQEINSQCRCSVSKYSLETEECTGCNLLFSWAADKDDILEKDSRNRNKLMRLLGSDMKVPSSSINKALDLLIDNLNEVSNPSKDRTELSLKGEQENILSAFDTSDNEGHKSCYYYFMFGKLEKLWDFLKFYERHKKHSLGMSEFAFNQIASKAVFMMVVNNPIDMDRIGIYDKDFFLTPVDTEGNYVEHIVAMRSNVEILKKVLDIRLRDPNYPLLSTREQKIKFLMRANKMGWDPLYISIKYFSISMVEMILSFLDLILEFNYEDMDYKDYLKELLFFAADVDNKSAILEIYYRFPVLIQELVILEKKGKILKDVFKFLNQRAKKIVPILVSEALEIGASMVPGGSVALRGAKYVFNSINSKEKGMISELLLKAKEKLLPISSNPALVDGFSDKNEDEDSRKKFIVLKEKILVVYHLHSLDFGSVDVPKWESVFKDFQSKFKEFKNTELPIGLRCGTSSKGVFLEEKISSIAYDQIDEKMKNFCGGNHIESQIFADMLRFILLYEERIQKTLDEFSGSIEKLKKNIESAISIEGKKDVTALKIIIVNRRALDSLFKWVYSDIDALRSDVLKFRRRKL